MSVETADAAAAADQSAEAKAPSMKLVVAASAAGTAFEWYDFFIFGSLAAILADVFYSGLNETARFIVALATFAVGFFVRPFGALVFGWIGDRSGRKGAFLITISMMGVATFAIGLLPTYAQAGVIAPILLVLLRVAQGLALGGEYGGAAVYVAEHAPDKRRGEFTSWIQTSAAFGLIGALAVILATRTALGEEAFREWGWRIPFLFSMGLLAISLWIRLQLKESPAFVAMKAAGEGSKTPFRESFGTWRYGRVVLLALFGIMIAQGAVWYAGYFYAQFFLERILKIAPATVNMLLIGVSALSAVLYVFFGWLSDRTGRKPVMLFGMLLFVVLAFPGFKMITAAGNPGLSEAARTAPVVVRADPADCGVLFDPVGTARFTSSCDLARNVLSGAGVPYTRQDAPPGTVAQVQIGSIVVPGRAAASDDTAAIRSARAAVEAPVKEALAVSGYPTQADPARIDLPRVFGLLFLFMVAATALYGPQAAALVELFPTRIRYTAMSLPYNIGTGWVGGFLPAMAFALVAATGDIYFGLWYPVLFTVAAILVAAFFLPETKGRSLTS
jgi:MFS family permease